MYTLALMVIALCLVFSIIVTFDIHHKLSYTSLRDHRKVLRLAGTVQILILLWIIGVILYRHVRIVNGWWPL